MLAGRGRMVRAGLGAHLHKEALVAFNGVCPCGDDALHLLELVHQLLFHLALHIQQLHLQAHDLPCHLRCSMPSRSDRVSSPALCGFCS